MSVGGAAQAAAATQSISTPGTNAGVSSGGISAADRPLDQKSAQTAPQFGEILQNVQSKYGARPEKGREIKKTLGKDDFLRIMITQMKNQDPTNPFKAEQMASEMAQFTTVEQLKNMNETLTKMTTANQPMERMAMTGMIGKTITIDRGRFPHTEGIADTVTFGLSRDAASATLALVDDHGETVLTKDLGQLKAGENSFNWDGKKLNTLPARTGNYMIRVEAVDGQGGRIETDSIAQGRVIGVSFEGSEPVFLVGDHKHHERITMKNVVKIDDPVPMAGNGGGAAPNPGLVSGAALGANAPKSAPQFFTFQKGVGSSNLDAASAGPDVQRAIAQYQAGQGQSAAPQAPAAPQPGAAQQSVPQRELEQAARMVAGGGFPNGLHDGDDSPGAAQAAAKAQAAAQAQAANSQQTGNNQKGGNKK